MAQPIRKSVLLERVKTAVYTLSPAAEIILFGSRARGTATEESDWDFLILLPSAEDMKLEAEIKDRLYDIELETDSVLSSIIRTKKEWASVRYAVMPLHQQVENDGVPI
ncbi:MAG: nucleotidyltransferase domain-containing protein [Anaerolineales bacterium]|nr:nucleotidyltransferase domain-containing protein [Anaerolineales bacterium]MCA9965492.1 nucleotidyltransferase domain-containing protein [Anaerolineales bacterium]